MNRLVEWATVGITKMNHSNEVGLRSPGRRSENVLAKKWPPQSQHEPYVRGGMQLCYKIILRIYYKNMHVLSGI